MVAASEKKKWWVFWK
ncbi:hypothetical protein P4G93_15650 [Bacillus cereus]|nr:hypothetical protein [Bacillus cereus]MEC0025167.1 hypothetical protein [Bacillus cereus]